MGFSATGKGRPDSSGRSSTSRRRSSSSNTIVKFINNAMKGFSANAATGAGLSDKGYASYVTSRAKAGHGTVIKNPLSYLMGMAALGSPVGWAGKKGYSEGTTQALVTAQSQNPQASLSELLSVGSVQKQMRLQHTRAERQAVQGSSQYGSMTTGYGKGRGGGYPPWVLNMMKGAGTELGKPPGSSGSSPIPIGLSLILLKVLL